MEQFARPDVVVFDVPDHRLERAAQLLRHIAHLEAHGMVYVDSARIEVEGPDSARGERATVALRQLDAERKKALAVRSDTLVVEGWAGAASLPRSGIA
jgi:hypothetical protein